MINFIKDTDRRPFILAAIAYLLTSDTALASEVSLDWHRAWHGRLMVLAWCILFPTGILAARFFKILPGQNWPKEVDNQVWWVIHQITQYAGLAAMAVAIWLIWTAPDDEVRGQTLHRGAGWIIVAAATIQLLGGLFRGTKGGPTDPAPDGSLFGDHYNMTPWRKAFEAIHKTVGYSALGLSIVAVLTGLYAAIAPVWMWLTICIWWSLLAVLWLVFEQRIKRIDTYKAIWDRTTNIPVMRQNKGLNLHSNCQ